MPEAENLAAGGENQTPPADYSDENEAATRDRIDGQLHQAGWEVESRKIWHDDAA